MSVTVTCVDDSPSAVDDAITVLEDAAATTIMVLSNDTDIDIDGGPISIGTFTDAPNGTVLATATELIYQPDPDYCNDPPGTTPDTFDYSLAPGGSTATVSVTVSCVDDSPTATDDDAGVLTEDDPATAIDVLANDTDLDGGPMSIDTVTDPTNGSVLITGIGTGLTYEPDPNYCGPDTFDYTLVGGSTATVTVTVTCVPDDTTAVDDTATMDEDEATTNEIFATANDADPEGDSFTIGSHTDPANGTVFILASVSFLYFPDPDYCNDPPGTSPDTFDYTLT